MIANALKQLKPPCRRYLNVLATEVSTTVKPTDERSSGSKRPFSVLSIDDTLNGLTDDQKELRTAAITFAQSELAPFAEEIDKTNNFSSLREFWKKCGDMGFHGITCPEEYGGKHLR